MTQTVTLRFLSEPVLMRVVRKQTAAAATALGGTEQHAGWIELAVSEALCNAHIHGYRGAPGPVELEIAYEGEMFRVTIRDEGTGFPFASDFPAAPDPRQGGGWGLQVIKELMDEVVLRPGAKGVGTTVRMSIRLGNGAEVDQQGDHHRFRREPHWQ